MSKRGRKRDPNAKRHQTTREGQGRTAVDRGTPELQQKRQYLSGDIMISTQFPLDILLSRKLISVEQYQAGQRFAVVAWMRFGVPEASCAALYQRMVADGAWDHGDEFARLDEYTEKRGAWARRSHEEMIGVLQPKDQPRHTLNAVQNATQMMRLPRFVANFASGDRNRPSDYREMARLIDGLDRLVDLLEGKVTRQKAQNRELTVAA
jgi:hypothetical protein